MQMWLRMDNTLRRLAEEGYHVVISCEGTAEQAIIDKLLEEDALVFPYSHVVDVTRMRKSSDIEEAYLSFDYDWPVCVVRVHDSRKESFRLGRLFAGRFPVVSVLTHPEMEILTIIREGEWHRWHKGHLKPSTYCSQVLGMRGIKSAEFLKEYWDVASIKQAAGEYRRLSKIPRGEHCLADLISGFD